MGNNSTPTKNPDDAYVRTAMETLDELDWCLDQLETMQTHKSVSGMASTKVSQIIGGTITMKSSCVLNPTSVQSQGVLRDAGD